MDKSQKILFDALGIVSVVGFAYAGYQIYKLLKNGKGERKSSFIGSNQKTIRFVLTNNTNQTQVEYLFDSRSGQNNPNVGISPNMDAFNAELSSDPKKVSKIEFRNIASGFSGIDAVPSEGGGIVSTGGGSLTTGEVPIIAPASPPIVDPPSPPATPPSDGAAPVVAPVASSSGYNQAEAPFKMNCKDASGSGSQQQFIPLISSTQFQSGITSVNMGGRILDGECFMEYTMYPNSKVAIIVYYEDFKLSDLLIKKKDETNAASGVNNTTANNATSPKKETQPVKAALGVLAVGALGFGAYKILQK